MNRLLFDSPTLTNGGALLLIVVVVFIALIVVLGLTVKVKDSLDVVEKLINDNNEDVLSIASSTYQTPAPRKNYTAYNETRLLQEEQ